MDHILVATAADITKGYYHTLKAQVHAADIDFMWKEINPFSWRRLVEWELEVALAFPKAFIAFCDSWDTLFLGDRNDLMRIGGRSPLTLHAEKVCWPHPEKALLYPPSTSPWCYVNGTGPAGIGSEIAEAIQYGMVNFPIIGDGTGVHDITVDNDQRFWTDVYLSGRGHLDTSCSLSQSLVDTRNGDFAVKGGRLLNKITGSAPIFVHANGAQSMLGFKPLMDLLSGYRCNQR